MSAQQGSLLVVDDNEMNLDMLSRRLTRNGYDVTVAANGEQALEKAERQTFDVVLLDIMMPGIDGFETCRQLKGDPATRESVVIFLSARGDVSDKVRGLELGAVDYIAKPFQAEEVIARVRTHLRNRSQRRKTVQS